MGAPHHASSTITIITTTTTTTTTTSITIITIITNTIIIITIITIITIVTMFTICRPSEGRRRLSQPSGRPPKPAREATLNPKPETLKT